MNNKELFARWFQQATENEPFPFQIRFACETTLPCFEEVTTTIENNRQLS